MSPSSRRGPTDYAGLYEAIPDAVLSVDRTGRILALNLAAETLSGYSREELIGQVIDVLVPEELRAGHAKHVESFLDRPETRELGAQSNIRLRRKDGEEIRVDIKLSPIGRLAESGINCIVRDIRVKHARETRLRQQAKYQAALAALGQRALSSGSLRALLDDAVATVATALDIQFCKVLERLPDREGLLLVSGVGWREGLVRRETVGTDTDSQAGYTLLSDEAVIVADLRTETRFAGPPLLTEHRVVSGMSVIIRGMKGPWGVLGAHTSHRRDFSKEEVQFLQATANLLGMAIERERADEARRESEDRMRASQKLEAIGRLAGGIAHDFNNLLVVIMASAERLDDDGEREAADAIMSAAERGASLTHQLLTFSSRQVLQPRILDINVEISGTQKMLGRLLGEEVKLVTTLALDFGRVRADPARSIRSS